MSKLSLQDSSLHIFIFLNMPTYALRRTPPIFSPDHYAFRLLFFYLASSFAYLLGLRRQTNHTLPLSLIITTAVHDYLYLQSFYMYVVFFEAYVFFIFSCHATALFSHTQYYLHSFILVFISFQTYN